MPSKRLEHLLHWVSWVFLNAAVGAAENKMKIYLLMLLIGTILTAIRFTSAPDTHPETRPQ
jgi:hypothetical protein